MTALAPTLEAFFTQHLAGHRQASPAPSAPTATPGGCSSATPRETTGTAPPASTSPPSTPGWSAASSPTSSRTGATPPGPATPDWPRSGRSSSSRPCAIPSTPRRSPGSSRSPRRSTAGPRLLPHRRRDRGPARRPGHRDVARPPRPRAPRPRRPDRAAVLRAHRADPRRRPDRDRADRPLPRQGPETADHPAHREHRRRHPHLAPPSSPANPPTRCSRPLPGGRLSSTPSRTWSDSTSRPRRQAARPSRDKNVTPHTLRHTAAMALLHAGVDTVIIALWLGHERADTTQIYLHADLDLKEKALARTTPPDDEARTLPAPRQAPRLPRRALIMPTTNSRRSGHHQQVLPPGRHNAQVGIVQHAGLHDRL